MRSSARRLPLLAIAVASLAIGSFAVSGCAPAATTSASIAPTPPASPSAGVPTDATAIGRDYVERLAAGDWTGAEAVQDATMTAAAPAATLATIWSQVVGQFGAYRGLGEVTTAASGQFTNVTVEGRFERATVPLIVSVSPDGAVAGFHLGQPGAAATDDPGSQPSYVDPSAFTETEVVVGEDPWALPGTLTMPAGDGPFPAVVLVAGSGPQDRDETIGPNTPLRDLAWGLASNGVAVLRYDKRTLTHGAAIAADVANITVNEETVDDAVTAVDLLRSTPGIDPERVVVAGHSLGGYLAPRIAERAGGRVAGIALLEGSLSPLERLIEQQLAYLASEEGGADPQARAMLEALPPQLEALRSPDLSPATPASSLPLGVPAAYWLDLRDYDPGATAAGLDVPILIVQGGRDYQVPPSELALWREALAGRDDVTYREYPALNHLLMAGEGPSRPAEYTEPGHVAEDVVEDLGAWVRSLP